MLLSRSTYCLASRTEFFSDSWTLELNQWSRLEKMNWLANQKRGTAGMSVRLTEAATSRVLSLEPRMFLFLSKMSFTKLRSTR